VDRFVYVSAVQSDLPSFVLRGYFEGKQRTEEALGDAFGERAFILRPGFIYGDRDVGLGIPLPLWVLGLPLRKLLQLPLLSSLERIPGMRAVLAPPVAVEDVGLLAASLATGMHQVSGVAVKFFDSREISVAAE
jgi:uncharacterized protein YbjT (DUF2867 family)